MNQSPTIHYVPGVCNIGPEEIKRRKNFGWTGLFVAVIVFIILVAIHANSWWRLIIVLPAAMSASGFLQAHFKFCFGFARKGILNFGNLGTHETVTDSLAIAKDQKRANQIMIASIVIGIIVALIAVVL